MRKHTLKNAVIVGASALALVASTVAFPSAADAFVWPHGTGHGASHGMGHGRPGWTGAHYRGRGRPGGYGFVGGYYGFCGPIQLTLGLCGPWGY